MLYFAGLPGFPLAMSAPIFKSLHFRAVLAARDEEGTLVFAEVALSEDPRDGFPSEGSPSALRRRMEAASIVGSPSAAASATLGSASTRSR